MSIEDEGEGKATKVCAVLKSPGVHFCSMSAFGDRYCNSMPLEGGLG